MVYIYVFVKQSDLFKMAAKNMWIHLNNKIYIFCAMDFGAELTFCSFNGIIMTKRGKNIEFNLNTAGFV